MSKSFQWCGYHWHSAMEGGRIIHPDFPWYWYSSDTIMLAENNTLELSIRRNPKEVHHWDGKTYNPQIEVATMRSDESFSFGTFSAEIKLPSGKNLWPSFWLTGTGNWPPEIDIMEAWSSHDSYFRMMIPQFPYIQPSWRTTTNVHYNNDKMEHKSTGSRNVPWIKQTRNPEFNTIKYECEWLPDKITIKVNGKEVRKTSEDICRMFKENLKNPEAGCRMNVIFNVWCENPDQYEVTMLHPMEIKNFTYTPLQG